MLRFAPFALVLVLAGCGAGANWTRPGGTAEQADADWDQCRNSQPGPRTGMIGASAGSTRGQDSTGDAMRGGTQTDQLVASRACMRERGWQPAR